MSTEQSNETFETFDSVDSEADSFETFDDPISVDEEDETEEPKKEKVKEDLKVLKDSELDSEGKEINKDKTPKKEAKKEEEEDEEEEEVEEAEEGDKEPKPSDDKKPKQKLRLRMGEELFNIYSDATLPAKIDGKIENVSVQELLNNYSGKTAWDKKFTEIGKERKDVEFQRSQVSAEKEKLIASVNKALLPIKDPEKNPMDSLLYLVEMSGEDPYTAYRRMMEANLEELATLADMTETERELYFHRKKDELQGKVYKQRQAKASEEAAFNQAIQRVNQLRQAHNVSEDEFVDASEELEVIYKEAGLDAESITEESVVDYASLKPHIATVKELVAPFEDNISEAKYGDVVAELSRSLRDGRADKETILELLKRNFSVEEDVKELNTKVYSKQKARPEAKNVNHGDSNGFESFEDWA